jgi:hypothetical protein
MEVPVYSLAERDRRWALAREIMAKEEVEPPHHPAAARVKRTPGPS